MLNPKTVSNPDLLDDALYGGRLTIDVDAIAANWRSLKGRLALGAECAATVKADAYGTGLMPVSERLWAEGCRTFFTALPTEALALRGALPDATIYVLDGVFPGTAQILSDAQLRPVLGSAVEVDEWAEHCAVAGVGHPAAIHVDTGIHRLGLTASEFADAMQTLAENGPFTPSLIISHLACGSDPGHPMNAQQLAKFREITGAYAHIPRSLANSAGVFLGPDFHFDLARPGISLYGGKAIDTAPNPMQTAVKVEARIMQVHDVPVGDTVGYGAAQTARRPLRNAVVAAGYADGMIRSASSSDDHPGGYAAIGGHKAPILGRISMDMITLDVTGIPEDLARRGAFAEMLGPKVAVSDLAEVAGSIDYEYLTSLGRRFKRIYAPIKLK